MMSWDAVHAGATIGGVHVLTLLELFLVTLLGVTRLTFVRVGV